MDPESNQMEQQQVQTVLCRNNCGFYGNVATESMCSVCYKKVVLKQQQAPTGMPASGNIASLSIDECSSSSSTSSSSPARPMLATLDTATTTTVLAEKRSASDLSTLGASASAASLASSSSSCSFQNLDVSDDDPSLKDGKKKKNRCLSCKKKVGLTGFTCRCGGLFCSIHRYSDKHDCNFDYKELGAEEIRKSNPVVVAKKVQKI